MDWINDAYSFLKMHSLINKNDVSIKEGSINIEQNGNEVVIKQNPSNRKEWEDRIVYIEKTVSQLLSGDPLVYKAKENPLDNYEGQEYCRLSIGLLLNSGIPAYKHYVLYNSQEKIIRPKIDHFEDLVIKGKLIDVKESLNLSLKDIMAFEPEINTIVNEYIDELDMIEQIKQKKKNLKNLEELYKPGRTNRTILFGISDNTIPIIEQSENELIRERQSIQRMYKRSVIIKPLSFGYIISKTPLYEE